MVEVYYMAWPKFEGCFGGDFVQVFVKGWCTFVVWQLFILLDEVEMILVKNHFMAENMKEYMWWYCLLFCERMMFSYDLWSMEVKRWRENNFWNGLHGWPKFNDVWMMFCVDEKCWIMVEMIYLWCLQVLVV